MKLIFIHGSGSCRESWQEQTRRFTEADAVDLPGHPHGRPCRTIDEYVQWLNIYVEAQGHKDLVLAGHSMGGAIALLYGLEFPAQVKGLICVGSGARLRVHPVYLEALAKALGGSEHAKEEAIRAFYPLGRMAPELAHIILRRVLENGLESLLNDLQACHQFDIMGRLSQINLPLLAICGSEDELTPCKYAHYLARHMPNATAVVIPGGTHFVHAEQPVAVNRAIHEFIMEL